MKKSYFIKRLIPIVLICLGLSGCGATKPPEPSGFRVPVKEFAAQRQQKALQKKEEAKENFGKQKAERNFQFGFESEAGTP